MATLSLNTSITSTHKNDFYSTTNEYWIKVNSVHGSYFSDSACPGGNSMDFQVRIHGTNIWKSIGGCSNFDYYYPPCYQYCKWDFIYARYYNFSNPNDTDNYKYIDKIAVNYLGLRNESFVNRCKINITTINNNNLPLPGVKILDSNIPTTNDLNYMVFTLENSGEEICDPTCRDPSYKDLTSELRSCNTEVSLMQTQKQNDIILIETYGIPNKLTFTVSTPGVYSGSLNYQYWNGIEWKYFQGVVDNTNGFRKVGINTVELPTVLDWKKRTIGDNPTLFHVCRAIFDSQLEVTTIPKASCFKWDGSYETVTDSNGKFNFSAFTSGFYSINIPGTLAGYIPISGNGILTLQEATPNKDITIILAKSDLFNNITCPTIVYKNQTKEILITSTVSVGTISNTLTISSPKTTTVTFNPISGIDIPVSYTFNEEDLYKIQLSSKDDGGNVLGKTCYMNVKIIAPGECGELTDQFSCELNDCFWSGNKCVSTDPHIELSDIYQSIINKTICISNECIEILDLNNDGIIDETDKDLSLNLTYDETLSKILSYQICKELNVCNNTKKSENLILYIGGGLAVGYIGYKLLSSNKNSSNK